MYHSQLKAVLKGANILHRHGNSRIHIQNSGI
jgi:hypothetical protein